jgi:hypothetical protein
MFKWGPQTHRFVVSLALLTATPAWAQGAGGVKLAPYTFEITPTLGVNLPHDIWGAQTLSIYGVRGAWVFAPGHGIEAGALYQSGSNDTGLTTDVLYRYEMSSDLVDTFFAIGWHFTKLNLGLDYDATGACDPANCLTDSGLHQGLEIGAGIQTPIAPLVPLRFGMRFLQKEPSLMLLLELGVGIRF